VVVVTRYMFPYVNDLPSGLVSGLVSEGLTTECSGCYVVGVGLVVVAARTHFAHGGTMYSKDLSSREARRSVERALHRERIALVTHERNKSLDPTRLREWREDHERRCLEAIERQDV
jgi:hypothetical protein